MKQFLPIKTLVTFVLFFCWGSAFGDDTIANSSDAVRSELSELREEMFTLFESYLDSQLSNALTLREALLEDKNQSGDFNPDHEEHRHELINTIKQEQLIKVEELCNLLFSNLDYTQYLLDTLGKKMKELKETWETSRDENLALQILSFEPLEKGISDRIKSINDRNKWYRYAAAPIGAIAGWYIGKYLFWKLPFSSNDFIVIGGTLRLATAAVGALIGGAGSRYVTNRFLVPSIDEIDALSEDFDRVE